MNIHRELIRIQNKTYIITIHIDNFCKHIILYLNLVEQISCIRILLTLDPVTNKYKDENYLKNKYETDYLENKNKLVLINELLVNRDVITIKDNIIYLTNSYLIKLL